MSAETFAEALDEACRRSPDAPALTWRGGHTTYGELGRMVGALAGAYHRMGIGRGERVVCQLPNRPEHVVTLGAAWSLAAVHVGADHELSGRELCWLVGHTQASALVYQPRAGAADPHAAARAVRDAHPTTRIIVVDDGATATAPPVPGWLRFQELLEPAPEHDGAAATAGPAPSDTAMLMFTSGTTGTPKGSMADHGSYLEGWRLCADMLRLGPDDVHLVHLPMAHAFGLSMAVMALITGGRAVLEESFSAEAALDRVASDRVSVLSGAPAHYIMLTDALDRHARDVSSLRVGVGSASAFSPELLARILSRLDIGFMVMYGSSEGVGVVTTDRDDMLLGAVGCPQPGEARIVAPDGGELATGEVGEIAFNRTISPVRYWGEAAVGSLDGYEGSRPGDGGAWYYTGDLGRIDTDGRLYVMGRLKHLVDRGGLKVDPSEVATVLLGCPGVADAAVVGTPNPVLGESICACVVPAGATRPVLAELRAQLSDRLAPHKLPDELCVLDAIPRTQLGKLDHDRLRALAIADAGRESIRDR